MLGHSTPFFNVCLTQPVFIKPNLLLERKPLRWRNDTSKDMQTSSGCCRMKEMGPDMLFLLLLQRKGLCHCYTLDIVFNSETDLCILFWMLTASSVHIFKHFFPRGWDCLGKWQSLQEVEPTWEKWGEGLGYLPVCTASWSTRMCPRCLILVPQRWRTAPFLLGSNEPSVCKPK